MPKSDPRARVHKARHRHRVDDRGRPNAVVMREDQSLELAMVA